MARSWEDRVVVTSEPTRRARRLLGWEVGIVLALSLGASAVSAVISFVGSLTAPKRLAGQTAVIVGSQAPGRPWLDLAWQLFGIATALVPVALVAYLLAREGSSLRSLGLDARRIGRETAYGAGIAAAIGGTGLALYFAARALDVNLTVVPSELPAVWWRIPVLVLSAIQNAVLEEVIVLGYLTRRLDRLGWHPVAAGAASAVLRGSYHLYQGVGGLLGNAAMGAIFAYLYRRFGRLAPYIIAHALIDIVAFTGSALLAGHVSWLPG